MVLGLLMAMLVVGPMTPRAPAPARARVTWYEDAHDPCAGMEIWEWRHCQPRVVNLGTWEMVPQDYKPSEAKMPADPKDWGEYPTEKSP